MGFMDTLLGRDSKEDDGPDVDLENEFDPEGLEGEGTEIGAEGEEIVEEPEPEPEDEEMEWDSAYDFAGWWLEDEGFANMRDFGEKAIMHRLERSEMYRDRIQSGMQTLAQVNQANEQLRQIRGKSNKNRDYSEMAEKINNANEVIEGVRSLSGEDEVIVQQGMQLAQDAISAIGERATSGGANVDTEVGRTGDEI